MTSRDHTGFHYPGLVAVVYGFISASKGADIAIVNIQCPPLVERAMAWHQELQRCWLGKSGSTLCNRVEHFLSVCEAAKKPPKMVFVSEFRREGTN